MQINIYCCADLERIFLFHSFADRIFMFGVRKSWPRCVVTIFAFATKQFIVAFGADISP